MVSYSGIPEGQTRQISLPELLFSELVPQVDNLGELKLILYIFYKLARQEGKLRYLRYTEMLTDEELVGGLESTQTSLDQAIKQAVNRGVILETRLEEQTLYFVNSPQGRAAVRAIEEGRWRRDDDGEPDEILPEPPNIFRLYEENIGPLTPLIAEAIGEAEDSYPPSWIEDAIRIAVERNKRSWRYAEAILKRWEREGRDVREKQEDQRESEEARRRYVEGEFSDFVEH